MNLFYREFGAGEPLIILHGLFGSSDNWVTFGKKMAEQYHVIIPDLRNHGQSPHSDEWKYHAMASDIHDLVNRLGFKSIILLGHSMGGKVGMTVADKFSDLLKKLIVVDIAPRSYPIHHRNIIDGLLSIDLHNLTSRKEADAQLAHFVPVLGIRQFLLKNLDRNSENGFQWKLNLKIIDNHLENVGVATYPQNEADIPTLFIRGINSEYVTDDDILDIRDNFSNSTIESIGNAGHWVHAEQPDAFYQTVFDFLKI